MSDERMVLAISMRDAPANDMLYNPPPARGKALHASVMSRGLPDQTALRRRAGPESVGPSSQSATAIAYARSP